MLKKSVCTALLIGLCCVSANSSAAICRAGAAAEAGSKYAYERARKAAFSWAERERNASDQFQSCVDRIKSVDIRLPSFPNLADLINQAAEKVCRSAVDKINDHIPDTIDPWEDYQMRY